MDLIPGLPNDLARECLFRLPFESFPFLLSVSKAWNREIRSPDFHHFRRISGHIRPVFILTERNRRTSSRSIRLFDPGHQLGSCPRLPPIPHVALEAPMFGGIVPAGSSSIVVITRGWRRSVKGDELQFINAVHVFDFFTGQWRRASDIPSHPDMWYGIGICGDPDNSRVLVVGGYGGQLRALSSALMYDVMNNKWICLDDMTKKRQSASVVLNAGRFHVIGGYNATLSYNQMRCAVSLDPETLKWDPTVEGFLEEDAPDAIVAINGDLYSVGQSVKLRRGECEPWEEVVEVPQKAWSKKGVVTWKDKMLVLGGELSYAGPSYNYLLDMKSCEWSNVDTVDGYPDSIVIEFGCGMDL